MGHIDCIDKRYCYLFSGIGRLVYGYLLGEGKGRLQSGRRVSAVSGRAFATIPTTTTRGDLLVVVVNAAEPNWIWY